MSDKAEDLARQLLEKTEGGKLNWSYTSESPNDGYWATFEKLRSDIEDGFSFSISRKANGDDKLLELELTRSGRTVLTAYADNLPLYDDAKSVVEQSRVFLRPPQENSPRGSARVERFRLFSDLFHAARKCATGGDRTIEKVQQLLERMG
jgi:hypothetical protein